MTVPNLSKTDKYLGPYLMGSNDDINQGIYTGDCRELAKTIPDESVDLIFCDPIYDRIDDYRWLAETAARVLKPDRACLAFVNGKWLSTILGNVPSVNPVLTYSSEGGPAPMNGKLIAKAHHLVWYGGRKLFDYLPDNYRGAGFGDWGFKWQKNPKYIALVIQAFTQPGDIVLDTYTGGGTVPAVCKMLSRNYIAFEIDPDTAERARERVLNTQPPLFVLEPEQMELSL